MIYYLNDQVITEGVVLGPDGHEATYPAHCSSLYDLVPEANTGTAKEAGFHTPCTKHQQEPSISGKFLFLLMSAYNMAFFKIGGCRCNV